MKRLGRWIDFENDYKTLDPSFMESVWWAAPLSRFIPSPSHFCWTLGAFWMCAFCGGGAAPLSPCQRARPPALPPPKPLPSPRWVFSQLHKKGLVYRGFKVGGRLAGALGNTGAGGRQLSAEWWKQSQFMLQHHYCRPRPLHARPCPQR